MKERLMKERLMTRSEYEKALDGAEASLGLARGFATNDVARQHYAIALQGIDALRVLCMTGARPWEWEVVND